MGFINSIRNLMTDPRAEITEVFQFEVDYRLPFQQQVAAGNYDYVNHTIHMSETRWLNEHYGRVGVAQFESALVRFTKGVFSRHEADELVQDIDGTSWEHSPIEPLLAFGARFPDEQRKGNIVAFNARATQSAVAFLGQGGPWQRKLDLIEGKIVLPCTDIRYLVVCRR
jgi:hypothetical protein